MTRAKMGGKAKKPKPEEKEPKRAPATKRSFLGQSGKRGKH